MQEKIKIPEDGIWILQRLQSYGYAVYAVGGCIRDTLLHKQPHDWDFCTNATPEQIQACFFDVPCFPIGIQHGTVSILKNGTIYEITTFRQESTYQDHRHPDSVQFTTSIYADLQRRDFTINAMAYHPQSGLVDPFHGAADLQKKNSSLCRQSLKTVRGRCPADSAGSSFRCSLWLEDYTRNRRSHAKDGKSLAICLCRTDFIRM